MAKFKKILTETEEELVKRFYIFRDSVKKEKEVRLQLIATKCHLTPCQLVCALGFNLKVKELTDIHSLLGFNDYQSLLAKRNDVFQYDTYHQLTLDNMITIYSAIKDSDNILTVISYLLKNRLSTIEKKIEKSVDSVIIDKYKAEIKAIYSDHIVGIDFVEERLDLKDNGFRALLNEVTIITESKIIPVGEIFFRPTILPQEKLNLLKKGLIPLDLVEARLNDARASTEEKKMLYDFLKNKKSH